MQPRPKSQSVWHSALRNVLPFEQLDRLPRFAFQLFFREPGPFLKPFMLLTVCSVVATAARFVVVWILSAIITALSLGTLTISDFCIWYLPTWIALLLLAEVLEFIIRRYGEALPQIYADYTALRLYLGLLKINSYRLFNTSKERISVLIGRYISGVQTFISDWIWHTSARLVRLLIVFCILAWQSPIVLGINTAYIVMFCILAFSLSRRMASYSAQYSRTVIEQSALYSGFMINLNAAKRLQLHAYSSNAIGNAIDRSWSTFDLLRLFHARRWFLQLNLFNLLYVGTLTYGVIQVIEKQLPLGFLLLIKWAFDELWNILVHFIEYYATLVQQDKENEIVRRELRLISSEGKEFKSYAPNSWNTINLKNVSVQFESASDDFQPPTAGNLVRIGDLKISRGDRIGIVGPSGVGKSTILNAILNFVPYSGEIFLDDLSLTDKQLSREFIAVIGNSDPLFAVSVRDNLVLGRDISDAQVRAVLKGVGAEDFTSDLDAIVGSPEFNLSTGQQQRIRLARGLLQDSSIYLLDEPFNGIDQATKVSIINYLKDRFASKTVVLVTHERSELQLVNCVYDLRSNGLVPE